MSNIVEQLKRLEAAGKANQESTAMLIAAAQKIIPSIRTRDEALELVRQIQEGELKP